MARPKKTEQEITPLELEIMKVLWETGEANVQSVQKQLPRDLAYTTVQTMLNVLHRKGKVERFLKDRTYFYQPVVSRHHVITQTIGDLVDRLFGGSADGLIMSLIETKHLTPEKLAELNKLVAREKEEDDDENV